MKLLVTGAAGLLGRAVVRAANRRGHHTVALARADLDVTDEAAVRRTVAAGRPHAVVHCAAFTDVDGAEAEPDAAFAVNEGGARHVARACAEAGCAVVYIGTDYIFDGLSSAPYRPDDPPRPLNTYGRSKLAGEEAVRAAGAPWLIVRTSWLYGPGGRNFVDGVLARARERPYLEVVDDQRGRPTWTGSLAPLLVELVERGERGVLHAADEGVATWHELAAAAVRLAGIATPVRPVPTARVPRPAARPAYSVLDLADLVRRLGRTPPHWRDSLRAHLAPDRTPGP